ncbi:hypothetical protein [Streptomyces sp. NPDC057682]|uniref:hypothetical protein n=1 Tax=unclassified Streptomyces TaxID=2593676 RepID=UPI003646B422
MDTARTPQTADNTLRNAERVRDELRDALTAAGVKLPSLGLDIASCAGPVPVPLVDLGRCNVETARALAAAVRSGQEAPR